MGTSDAFGFESSPDANALLQHSLTTFASSDDWSESLPDKGSWQSADTSYPVSSPSISFDCNFNHTNLSVPPLYDENALQAIIQCSNFLPGYDNCLASGFEDTPIALSPFPNSPFTTCSTIDSFVYERNPPLDSGHSSLEQPWSIEVPEQNELYYELPEQKELYCEWPECSRKLFTPEEHKIHNKQHGREVRMEWTTSKYCSWYGCTSKARHRTPKQLEDHLNNIHINPLICTRDGCSHKSPFRGKADLQRHIDAMHKEKRKIKCPYQPCTSKDKSFCRKDKLISHVREIHDTSPCPYVHCKESRGSTYPCQELESSARHIGKEHGEFECALGACQNSKSQFSETALLEHLQVDHSMVWERVMKTKGLLESMSAQVLKPEHVGVNFYDCIVCQSVN